VESLAEGLDEDQLRRATAGSARPVAQLSQHLAERAGQLVPMTGDNPQTLRFLLYEAVSSFIRQATESAPVVITLDDIHWADVPSLELLSYLTPSLSARPVLVVAAYRDLPVDRTEGLDATLATVSREDIVEEVALGGLGPTDVALLTDDLLGTDNDTETRSRFVTLLHERTGGNPFFVRQLARLIVDAESYVTDPSDTPVPAGVRHVISSRLHGLPPAVDALLAAGAVIGREFDLRTAAAAAGLPSRRPSKRTTRLPNTGWSRVRPAADASCTPSCRKRSSTPCRPDAPRGCTPTSRRSWNATVRRRRTSSPDTCGPPATWWVLPPCRR
jgi:hypothetical protein